jgi:hypothetical protein
MDDSWSVGKLDEVLALCGALEPAGMVHSCFSVSALPETSSLVLACTGVDATDRFVLGAGWIWATAGRSIRAVSTRRRSTRVNKEPFDLMTGICFAGNTLGAGPLE